MKRTIQVLTFLSLAGISANIFSYPEGAPFQSSGAPGESTCAKSGCHSGTLNPANGGSVSIAIAGDSAHYTPGVTYDIEVTVSYTGRTTFGFALTAKTTTNSNTGTLGKGGNTAIQVLSGYATQTNTGKTGTDAKTWKVKWTAPSSSVGTVTFYAAGNAANGNGSATGDFIYSTSKTFPSGVTGIADLLNEGSFSIYPVPVNDRLNLSYWLKEDAMASFSLFDLTGKEVLTTAKESQSRGLVEKALTFDKQPDAGIYLLKIRLNDETLTRKVFIN